MSWSSKSEDNLLNAHPDDENYSSRTSFYSLDESYYKSKPVDAAISGKLLFWPPVQAYKVLEDNGSFEFDSLKGLNIYAANIECRQALETSAFVEFLQSTGISATLKNKALESDMLVYIKPTICDQPESFELQVRANKIIIIAGDHVGIMYALTALKDLLTYSATVTFENNAKQLRLQSLLLSDAPRFRTRAVQWSYQYHVYAPPRHPASTIRMLSALKINTIFLHLDQVFELYQQEITDTNNNSNNNESDNNDTNTSETIPNIIQKELFFIHDLAKSHGIRVIPTVVLSTVDKDYKSHLQLLQLPLWSQILLVCDFTAIAASMTLTRNKDEMYRHAYLQALYNLQHSISPNVTSVYIAVNPIIANAVSAENIPESLQSLPLTFFDYSLYQAEPLRRKPLVLMRECVESMVYFVEHVLSGASSDILLLPMHGEKDFLVPEVLQNYVLLLYSALAAFGPRMVEFFATAERFQHIAKPLARLLHLNHASVLTTEEPNVPMTLLKPRHQHNMLRAQQDVFLELMNWRSGLYSNNSTDSNNNITNQMNMTKAAVEQALWSLSLMTDDIQPSDLPRPEEALALFRLYRSLLQSARYPNSTIRLRQQKRHLAMRYIHPTRHHQQASPINKSPRLHRSAASSSTDLASHPPAIQFAEEDTNSTNTTNDMINNNINANNNDNSSNKNIEDDMDMFFSTVENLCMVTRAVYLAASLASNGNQSSNDASNSAAAVLAELLPNHKLSPLSDPSSLMINTSDTLSSFNNTSLAANTMVNTPHNNANNLNAMNMNNSSAKRAAVYDNVDMSKPYAPKVIPKTANISQLLNRVVQQNILFRNFKSEEHASIVEAFECVATKAGEIVIKQGDSGEYFYIIEQGKMDIFMESCGLRIKVGRSLGTGDYFGELALMYNTPRAATVVSTEASTLWRIDRTTYRSIVTHHNKITSDEYFQLVSNVSILGKKLGDVLSAAELSKVVSTLEIEEFEPESVIIRQHATGDYFYIISEGQVDVFQEQPAVTSPGSEGADTRDRGALGVKLARLSRGDCFGEKALLADDVRQASCVAVGRVVCLSLSRDDFIAMIGSWQDVTAAQDAQRLALAAKRAKIRASVYDSQYHLTINLDELERLNTLGEGAFGRVLVARHKNSGQLYALKCQAKAFICAQNMQDMVLNEVAIMKQLDHPLVTKLHAVMQDRRYIYFLLELLPGGEFFSFLQTAGKLTEDKARFYAASVVLALEELHKAKIAYRDLKPENMVMDSRGYVKLVDFGLAKQVLSGSTWTMCGTPDYLAPEIILNKGHNHAVDYWALGVLIYEMIHGWPPFYHDSPMKVYEKIIMGKVDYPGTFSKALEDIVSKFLVKNPSKRLGNIKGGITDITKHKWFGSFDWRGLMAGTLLAPVMPNLSAFDAAVAAGGEEEDDEEDEVEREQHQETDWMPDLL